MEAGEVGAVAGLIEQAFRDHLEMRWLVSRGPGGLRMSELGSCRRRHVARVLGYLQEEPTLEDAALWEAGLMYEDYTAQILERACGPHGVGYIRAVQIVSPYCSGVADWLILRPAPIIVDTKSVDEWAEAWGLPRPEHVTQLRAYMRFCPEDVVGGLLLYWLKGKSLRFRLYPVPRDPEAEAAVEEELAFLADCVERGVLPAVPEEMDPFAFPCRWEGRANGLHVCGLWESCFGRFPEVASERAVEAARELERLRREQAALYQELHRLRQLARRAEAVLEAAAGGLDCFRVDCDGFAVEGVLKRGQPSYDLKRAIEAGVVREDALQPFLRPGRDKWEWTIRYRVGGGGLRGQVGGTGMGEGEIPRMRTWRG